MAQGPSALIGNKQAMEFIRSHESDDPFELTLTHREVAGLPVALLARQIKSRQKAHSKLPEWNDSPDIIFPDPANLQQSSSEATAKYKASITHSAPVIDLTGGTGVDLFYISGNKKAIYVDPDPELCRLAEHNFTILHKHLKVVNSTAESFVNTMPEDHQLFLDPSRRDEHNNKMIRFSDCLPDVTKLLPELLEKTNDILLKASPMMDISQACRELLMHVHEVHVLEWEGECRELLFVIHRDTCKEPLIRAVDLSANLEISFRTGEEKELIPSYGPMRNWLYEPSPAMLKAGAFNVLANRYQLTKIHPNTHLYTSESLVMDFPGRTFRVIHCQPYSVSGLKKSIQGDKANISTRNFPESVKSIRKKTGLKDGGTAYVFAFRNFENKKMFCSTIRPEKLTT